MTPTPVPNLPAAIEDLRAGMAICCFGSAHLEADQAESIMVTLSECYSLLKAMREEDGLSDMYILADLALRLRKLIGEA